MSGEEIKLIRTDILMLTQSQFSQWLYSKGICGRKNEPYSVITIASWENGRRAIPKSVAKIIRIDAEKKEGVRLGESDIIEMQTMQIERLKAENDIYKQIIKRLIGA